MSIKRFIVRRIRRGISMAKWHGAENSVCSRGICHLLLPGSTAITTAASGAALARSTYLAKFGNDREGRAPAHQTSLRPAADYLRCAVAPACPALASRQSSALNRG